MGKVISKANKAAILICIGFIVLQAFQLGYGTWINDLPHIANSPLTSSTAAQSLQRNAIVSRGNSLEENQDTWLLRYKLYAVTADEMVNLMALSRIQPAQLQFDPHYYMYGGAYLYPLGAWFGVGHLLGLFPIPALSTLIAEPDITDSLYIWGRAFVLIAFSISAWIFFQTTRLLFSNRTSFPLLLIYLTTPASLMFSINLKPHWYALLWATIALYFTVRLFTPGKLSRWQIFALAVSLGLAVGSSTSYGLFAIIIYGALIVASRKSYLPIKHLILIPLMAIAIFIITNPYVLLNYAAYQQEQVVIFDWYTATGSLGDITKFITNSLQAGFGIAGLFALGAAIWEIAHRKSILRVGLSTTIIGLIIFASIMTSTVSYWNSAYRFIPFFLPFALLLIGKVYPAKYVATLAAVTILLAVPTVVAYMDENSSQYSTRKQAAVWIESNIPLGSTICAQMAPYSSAPFDFTKYTVSEDCQYAIEVHPHNTTEASNPVVAEFIPRMYSASFPLVHGHAQPRIFITTP